MKPEKILICDDNEFVLKTIEFALRAKGFIVDTAMSTSQVYQKIEKNKPDVIFLDLNLPEEGGESVVHNLHNRTDMASVAIILFSGEEKLSEIAARLNVSGFLKKPFDNDSLIAAIHNLAH